MVQSVFVTALTMVSALALALVYGLGGYFALQGQLEPGDVVALALLLTRLYAPLTALASARVEVMSALVSFERVFEVLDLVPLITEAPDARAVPAGPVTVEFDLVSFGYPAAEKVSLASLEEVAKLDPRAGVEVLHEVWFRAEPGQMVALVGSSGAGKSTIATLLPRLYDVDAGAVRLAGVDVRELSFGSLRDTIGLVTQDGHLFHESIRGNPTSEAAVQEALAEALAGRTAVVIAHRLSTVRAADVILVVEGGRVVERGTHAELLVAGGRYEELHRTQFEAPFGGPLGASNGASFDTPLDTPLDTTEPVTA